MRSPTTLVALVLAALVATACGGGSATSPADAHDGSWVLRQGRDAAGPITVPAGETVTLVVDGTALSGRVCNSYFADRDPNGSVSGVGGTDMACLGPLMETEQRYYEALAAVTSWAIVGDVLTLTGRDGVELVFDRASEVPDAALVGTDWRLDSLLTGLGPNGTATTPIGGDHGLALEEDGSLSAATGCNGGGGAYEVEGDVLVTSDIFSTMMACDEPLMRQERHIFSVLEANPSFTIEGSILTLRADGADLGLVYRAAP